VEKPNRNVAIDAYRGFVMLLMMAEVLELSRVSKALPGNAFWSFLAFHQTHSAWVGCSLHDTIQPGFSFLVGVALPYSIASRLARGETFRKLFAHALWRGFLLVALGIFLRSINAPRTYFTFEDTLTQIGLGYPLLFPARLASAEMAVDRARRDPLRVLAGVGALSAHPRRLQRISGALE
jgi:heparan-alpha-glucosaminide N-acetyltransferase